MSSRTSYEESPVSEHTALVPPSSRASRLSSTVVNLQETVNRLRIEEATEVAGVRPQYGRTLANLEENVKSIIEIQVEVAQETPDSNPEIRQKKERELSKRMTVLLTKVNSDLAEIRKQREEHLALARKIAQLKPAEKQQYLEDLRKRKPAKMLESMSSSSSTSSLTSLPTSASTSSLTSAPNIEPTRPMLGQIPATQLPHPKAQGWMVKLGGSGGLSNWRKRYFVISEGRLYYFKTPDDGQSAGNVDLYQATIDVSTDYQQPFLLKLSSPRFERVYYFSTESKEDQDTWLKALREAANLKGDADTSVLVSLQKDAHLIPRDSSVPETSPKVASENPIVSFVDKIENVMGRFSRSLSATEKSTNKESDSKSTFYTQPEAARASVIVKSSSSLVSSPSSSSIVAATAAAVTTTTTTTVVVDELAIATDASETTEVVTETVATSTSTEAAETTTTAIAVDEVTSDASSAHIKVSEEVSTESTDVHPGDNNWLSVETALSSIDDGRSAFDLVVDGDEDASATLDSLILTLDNLYS